MNEFLNQIINNNKNLSDDQKDALKYAINQIDDFFIENFNIGISLINSAALLSNLKQISIDEKSNDKAYYYDFSTNSIINNTAVNNDSRKIYDYCIAVFDIITKKYNKDMNYYEDGLIYKDENGKTFGSKINSKLKHQLVVLLTDEVIDELDVKDFYVDKADDSCTLEDALLIDINSIISSEELVTYFLNADGALFYEEINKRLNEDEEKTKNFFRNIDEYTKENSIEKRKKYVELFHQIKQYNNENINNMNIA